MTATDTTDRLRPVRIWLLTVAVLIAAIVIVGGATRLTESGLSITEWNPVTGVLPPLSDADWNAEFEKYQQIPQYQQINRGMSLDDFKTIFHWEWGHRLLGRMIGFVFALPLAFFWFRGYVDRTLGKKLLVLLALGGLQGAVGWWMVSSGLVDRVSVAPYRLATHLTLAFLIFATIFWILRGLRARVTNEPVPSSVRLGAWVVLGTAFVQVFLGAIVAGLDAGMSFTTWPLMDGHFIPSSQSLFVMEPAIRNLFENPMTAQFFHRMVAYGLFVLAALHCLQCVRVGGATSRRGIILFSLVFVQATLGILTLVNVVPLGLALAHQFGALAIIGHATGHVRAMSTAAVAAHRPLQAAI